jgi:hypothetical protein
MREEADVSEMPTYQKLKPCFSSPNASNHFRHLGHCGSLLPASPSGWESTFSPAADDRRVCAIWHSSGDPSVHILRPIFEADGRRRTGTTEHIEDGP